MFPEAAAAAVQLVLADAAHSMEEQIEVRGHAPFPTLDSVRLFVCLLRNLEEKFLF